MILLCALISFLYGKKNSFWKGKYMKFRPCIDIHNGKVKQIVGGSLEDRNNLAAENFISEFDAGYYAELYRNKGLKGGHIIMLNPKGSEYYNQTRRQAMLALKTYPGGLQIGGGICAENAEEYLKAGAAHIIVTSYVFQGGEVKLSHLEKLKKEIGREKIVLDLSCRRKNNSYYIVTDRWQKYTNVILNHDTLDFFADFCDEFLIHAVDVEGKGNGIETELVKLLGEWNKIPITYAGGVHNIQDLTVLRKWGENKIDVTIGSALDIFGGKLMLDEVLAFMHQDKKRTR